MPDRFTPRYFEIEQELRALIETSARGDVLPSDAQLTRQYGVSRMTVRQAFAALVQEGLVERIPGSGSFVLDKAPHRHATVLVGFSDEQRRNGRVPASRLLEATQRRATAAESEALRLPRGAKVVSIRRLRLADDIPIAIEHARLRTDCSGVLDHDLVGGSLHAALAAVGVKLTHGRATINVDRAGTEEAKLLSITKGDPLLVEQRTIFDIDKLPCEFTESRYAYDRYQLDVDFIVAAKGH